MKTDTTLYSRRFECEHAGDLRSEIADLEDAGAEIVSVEEDPHGDEDYYATVTFAVRDAAKFEREYCPVSKLRPTVG